MRARTLAPVGVASAPAITGLCWALCAWEARRARGGPRPYVDALPADGMVGAGLSDPVRITWIGDSLAAGLGCDELTDTPAHLTARLLERPVAVRVLAVPGSRVEDVIEGQVPLIDVDTDLVVLSVGANDVASATSRSDYAAGLDSLLAALAPTPTVMLSLPDMAMADRMAQPLRSLAGARARWFEVARSRVAGAHRHVHSVDVASRPAGMSRSAGRSLLSADRFHPGAQGYRVWAERIAAVAHQVLESGSASVEPQPVPAGG